VLRELFKIVGKASKAETAKSKQPATWQP